MTAYERARGFAEKASNGPATNSGGGYDDKKWSGPVEVIHHYGSGGQNYEEHPDQKSALAAITRHALERQGIAMKTGHKSETIPHHSAYTIVHKESRVPLVSGVASVVSRSGNRSVHLMGEPNGRTFNANTRPGAARLNGIEEMNKANRS